MAVVQHSTSQSAPGRHSVGALLLPTLAMVWAVLLSLNILNDIWAMRSGDRIWLLDVDVERSFYTWASQLLLAGVATLLLDTGAKMFRADHWVGFHWLGLSAIFGLLSADEALSLHELLSGKITDVLPTSGFLTFAWVMPAIVICAAGLAGAIPFLLKLPGRVRALMLLAAALFLFGAVGMEMVGGQILSTNGDDASALPYRLAVAVEEGLEGLGVLVFLYSHLLYRSLVGLSAAPARPA